MFSVCFYLHFIAKNCTFHYVSDKWHLELYVKEKRRKTQEDQEYKGNDGWLVMEMTLVMTTMMRVMATKGNRHERKERNNYQHT